MACDPTLTLEELRAELYEKQTAPRPRPDSTVEELKANLDLLTESFVKITVPTSSLPKNVRSTIIADKGEVVERYALKGESTPAVNKRATDEVTRKFIKAKTRAKAEEITLAPDTRRKANAGTKVHSALEGIMNLLIDRSTLDNVEKPSKRPALKSLKQIKEDLEVDQAQFNELVSHQNRMLNDISRMQRELDPKGKVRIFPEQFLLDNRKDTGATADVIIVFSDKSYGQLDYKSMIPNKKAASQNRATGKTDLVNPNWIPPYKFEDFNIQLPIINEMMETRWGFKNNRFSRVVPIQLDLHMKPEKEQKYRDNYTDRIKQLSMGTGSFFQENLTEKEKEKDIYLGQIPVQETTGIDRLDKAIKQLTDIKNNLQIDLDDATNSARKDQLELDLSRKQRMLNKMIMNHDISVLRYDVNQIVKRYLKDYNEIVDINNETINNKENPNYLSDENLNDIVQDFKVYQNLLQASIYHMKELGVPKKELEEYEAQVGKLAIKVGFLLNSFQETRADRAMSKEERLQIKDARKLSWWEKLFTPLGLQTHPVLVKFHKLLSTAQNKKRIDSQRKFSEIRDRTKALQKWGAKNGKSLSTIYDMLYNKETGNLYSKHNKDFYDDLKEAQQTGNTKWLSRNLQIKENAKELYDANLARFEVKEPTKDELRIWKHRHNFKNVIKNSDIWYFYYEISDEVETQYLSEGYQNLLKPGNKALLDYWNFYTSTMKEAKTLLGLRSSQRVPPHFLPNIRAGILEQSFQDGWNWQNVSETVKELVQVREDDIEFGDPTIQGKIDPETGEEKYTVPKYYINPIKDNSDRSNLGLKSRDLGKSLFVFYEMALNYEYMHNEVEPKVEALKDIMAMEGIKPRTEGNLKEKNGFLARVTGKNIDVVSLFDTFVKYHLYGIRIQDATKKQTKFWKSIRSYQMIKELAFSPLVWGGNWAQVKGNTFFTGANGQFYTVKDQWDTQQIRLGAKGKDAKELYHGLVYFFEPSVSKEQVFRKQLTSRRSLQAASMDTAFWGFRKTEEQMSHDVLVNILKNHAFDENGRIQRVKNLPEGTKSLFEQSKVKDDNVIVEGVIDEKGEVDFDKYTQIRNKVLGVSRQISGQMNPDDVYAAQTMLSLNLVMSFKNWMPGMWEARGGRMRYNPLTQTVMEGKYTSLLSDMDGNKKVIAFIGTEFLPRLAKFVALSPFIAVLPSKKGSKFYKINEARARAQFDKFKSDNLYNESLQGMLFEDFVEYRQGQIRSLAAELMVIMSFVAVLMTLGMDWDDDGKADWTNTSAGRTLYRLLNRGRRELAFFINPNDWYTLLRTPVPQTGLALDAISWFNNLRDETGDAFFGEDERTGWKRVMFKANRGKDEKPVFYETIGFIPGNKLLKMFEVFEAYEAAEY